MSSKRKATAKSIRVYRRNFIINTKGNQVEIAPTFIIDTPQREFAALAILRDVAGEHFGRQYIIGNTTKGIKWIKKYGMWKGVLVEAKYKLAKRMYGASDPFDKHNVYPFPGKASAKRLSQESALDLEMVAA